MEHSTTPLREQRERLRQANSALIFTAENTYTGPTTITGGLLRFDGSTHRIFHGTRSFKREPTQENTLL